MDDYIKRKDALKWIVIDGGASCSEYSDCEYKDTDKACSDCLYADVNKIPAADVRKNVRGEWKQIGNGDFYKCSICSCGAQYGHYANFCPNCGAEMRGEKDGNRQQCVAGDV